MSKLSDLENCSIGIICGVSDTTLLQSTNYWKNAQQQGLPFTLNPAVLYRGYAANTLNNGLCVMSQFFLNGVIKNALTGGVDRELSKAEKIGAGIGAGALSSIVGSPLELTMIQQQVKGESFMTTFGNIIRNGTALQGIVGMMAREGIYCGGYLGLMPVVREEIRERYPTGIGKSDDSARLFATMFAGPICSFASHPPDTLKTCLQGDVEGAKYRGYVGTARTLIAERGVAALWAGMPWRVFRQFCAIFLFDKINTEVAPMLYPHRYK